VNVNGSHHLQAPREAVFRAICDPAVLLEILPGCDEIEQVSASEYRGRLTLRLPGIVGSYRTTVRLVDAEAPDRAGMEGRLEGTMGTIHGRAEFVLRDAGGATELEYRGTGTIQGSLAMLDSRFAERLAESLIAQGLRALDLRLARDASQGTGPGGPRTTTEGSE
jgi:uncharacterized protein